MRWTKLLLLGFLLWTSLALGFGSQPALPAKPGPEDRAVAYLIREVPRWSAENKCYSCHNNGDAARALYTAQRLGYTVPAKALADTTQWLAQPQKWDHNGGEGPFSDKVLARIQFAAALVEAVDAEQVKDRAPLRKAAELVVEHQQPDGSWKLDGAGAIGSPATYGTVLAAYLARRTLQRADPQQYKAAIAKADRWFQEVKVTSVLDAAAVLLSDTPAQQKHCLELIRKGQAKDGGWGPYATSPTEPFDTAVVMLALIRHAGQPDTKVMLQRGRAYLIATQLAEGGWLGTTRPPGGDSYAEHIATTGWATLALLATRGNK